MTAAVLALNAGSSSLKFALFEAAGAAPAVLVRGQIEDIENSPHFVARTEDGARLAERRFSGPSTHEAMLRELLDWIDDHLGPEQLIGVGHRIVHGGSEFVAPVELDSALLAKLEKLSPLAPLHQPHNIAAVRAIWAQRPCLPQIGCFDTAFHRTLPSVATRFALTADLHAQGVRRYGFHGLSYAYVAERLAELDPELARGRVIAAHLGAGASLCALKSGRSVDTTLGFSTADGLMMATRCGALDPGVPLYLMESLGYDVAAVEDLIYRRSGLLGVSGISGDLRELLDSRSPAAASAVELYIWRIAREAGAMASVLGGVDGVVFTAGVGENAPFIRSEVCRRLAWLGVALDPAANAENAPIISTAASAVTVRVIPTDEERMIARDTLSLLAVSAPA